ncbi:MAG: hypothetical protein GY757_59145 [bacterium]|nr:hypothetical protein [bacterium]
MSISIIEFINKLKKLKITIHLEKGRLQINAAKGRMTPGLLEELKERKPEIVQFLETVAKQVKYRAIEPAEKRPYYPLAPAQKRLYILQLMEKESTAYNLPFSAILEGDVDKKKFETVFENLLARHESFRTTFRMIEGEPVQKLHGPGEIKFSIEYSVIDKTGAEAGETGNTALLPLITAFERPFELTAAPLLRVGLVRITGRKHLLLFDMHHIITDGTSKAILAGEIMNLY